MNSHYYNIDVQITIGNTRFTTVTSVRIENDRTKIVDIAKIELPREFRNARKQGENLSIAGKNILDVIKNGDQVIIEAGYDGDLYTEYEGYVSDIGAEIPLTINCEDEMYQLKKMPKISTVFPSVSLKDLLAYIAPGYTIDALDIALGKFEINQATPFKVIEALKDQYGISCKFEGKTLVAGLMVSFVPGTTHNFVFGKNIRKSSDLVYKQKDSRKTLVKATSIQSKTSEKIIYEFGDAGENEITLHGPLNLTRNELKKWAEDYYNSKVFDGFEGSVDGWGLPRVSAGDAIDLKDPNYPDGHRDAKYYVESVVKTINSQDGFKRKCALTFKL